VCSNVRQTGTAGIRAGDSKPPETCNADYITIELCSIEQEMPIRSAWYSGAGDPFAIPRARPRDLGLCDRRLPRIVVGDWRSLRQLEWNVDSDYRE
jgi:hypothetical protein